MVRLPLTHTGNARSRSTGEQSYGQVQEDCSPAGLSLLSLLPADLISVNLRNVGLDIIAL